MRSRVLGIPLTTVPRHSEIRQMGIDTNKLLVDECRLIVQGKPKVLMGKLEEQFRSAKNIISVETLGQVDLMDSLTQNPDLKINLIFGEHDTLTQLDSIHPSLQKHPQVNVHMLPNAGHDAYRTSEDLYDIIVK